jgi:glutamine amidotransferase
MNSGNVVIIDYGVGNIESIKSAIRSLGIEKVSLSNEPKHLSEASALILPGVGAFGACVSNLKRNALDRTLADLVVVKKKPLLGICVGMQLLADFSEENGVHQGLGWIPGKVVRLSSVAGCRIPHVGWNEVHIQEMERLGERFKVSNPEFYFDHSYHFTCDRKYITGSAFYGQEIVAVVRKENIVGVQFHPEKSNSNGLRIFRSFFNSISLC